jgi:Metallo-peptidase family M12
MPSLRDSGKIVGSAVSIKQLAQQCNLSFPLSLRQFISTSGCPFSRCIRLHIKVLTNPSISIETMLNRMREVYSTAGIRVVIASREDLTSAVLGNANFTTLNDLDVGQCDGATSNEQNQIFQNQNNVPVGQRNNEIVVYFVRSVTKTAGGALNGCATFPSGQPGAVIAQMASQWTLAHEVGHVFGLNHIAGEHQGCPALNPQCCSTPDFTRLMTGCSTSNIVGTPTVNQTEINAMTNSNLTRQC